MAIKIDGSKGGQVLRTALGLSCLLQKPFSIINIRKSRPRCGLASQHLHTIKACQTITDAKVQGAQLGSEQLLFIPQKLQRKPIHVCIPTAGSVTLVMQALSLAYLTGKRSVTFHLEGGTDVPHSMPLHYYTHVVLHNLQQYFKTTLAVQRRGFYPRGGGSIELTLKPQFAQISALPVFEQRLSTLAQIRGILYATPAWQDTIMQVEELLRLALQQKYAVPVQLEIQHAKALDEGAGLTLQGIMHGPLAIGYSQQIAEKDVQSVVEQIMRSHDFSQFDEHYLDNIIPLMGLCTGSIPAQIMTEHMQSAMTVTEAFLPVTFTHTEGMLRAQRRANSNS